MAGAAVCGITSGTAAGGGAGVRAIGFAAGFPDLRALRALGGAFFALAERRAGFLAAARFFPAERFRPRVLLRAFFEPIFRFAIRYSDRLCSSLEPRIVS
jgi:hypothetical protein